MVCNMKENMMRDTFSGLDNKFGSNFELEDSCKSAPKEIVQSFSKSEDDALLPDADYIACELKMAVESISDVMEKLGEDLKVGAPPRMFEVYAKLADSKINALDKLTSKSKIQLDAKIKTRPNQQSNVSLGTNNNIILTSKGLLDLIRQEQPKTNTSVQQIDIDV